MLTKPTVNALKALYSISIREGWDHVKAMFEVELAQVYAGLASHQDEVRLRQLQGRAQAITEFLDLVDNSRAHLEKLRANTL